MKKARLFLMMVSLAILAVGCSKDDDKGGGETGTAPEGVPTGEIVPVDQRNEVLTGFDMVNGESKGTSDTNESQRWWTYKFGEIMSTECPEYEQQLQNDYFIAWTNDGRIIYKYDVDGEIIDQGKTWEWKDNSTKDVLILNGSAEFTLSKLNDGGVVYYSEQDNLGCAVTVYEEVNEPHYE